MTVDEYGREPGVDYAGQVWTIHGQSISDYDPALDAEDQTAYIKLFRYARSYDGARTKPPIDLDYITGLDRRLYKDEYFVQGELRRVDFYAETSTGADGWPAYSDLVIREDISYTRDALGFARERTTVITWFTEAGDAHATTKALHKPYSMIESQKEGTTRRQNIIAGLSLKVAGILVQILPTGATYPDAQAKIEVGRNFLQEHKIAMDMFVAAAKRDIVADVKHAPDAWLGVVIAADGTTVRDLILTDVDIWGIRDSV